MLKQVLLDQLSEFLMVEQGGLELYRVAASRARNPELKAKYEEFGRETAHHREVLVRLIERLGGDPSHVSPTARVAQFKAAKLLESAMVVDGLDEREIELSDLENVLLAETKDHADWTLLQQMADKAGKGGLSGAVQKAGSVAGAGVTAAAGGPTEQVDMDVLAEALQEAVAEVGPEEDEHLRWAREKLIEMSLHMGMLGPAPSPQRWQDHITNPEQPLEDISAAPKTDGLLSGAQQPFWQPSTVVRTM